MTTNILPIYGSDASLELVGGKGQSLSRLAQTTLPVPGGFILTTQAYRQFIEQNELTVVILAGLNLVDSGNPASFEIASLSIREQMEAASIPPQIADEILAAYAALPGQNPPVAVRSSATAEDLPGASFAGQQETYLNVMGASALLVAVKKCWSSLWTGRAIAYRAKQNINPEGIALAVVVQELVPAEKAGILFTANPMNGSRDQVVINAAWGLGEAIVSGMVTPDTYIIDTSTNTILSREIADKQLQTVRTAHGTQEQAVPARLRKAPVLSDSQVLELVEIGKRIEKIYGSPTDIEWAFANGSFYVLQARPITSLQEKPFSQKVEWIMPNPKLLYARGSLAEQIPNPVTPLFGTLGLRAINQGYQNLATMFKGGDIIRDYQHIAINGYVYISAGISFKDMVMYIRTIVPQLNNMFRHGYDNWQSARDELLALVTSWKSRDINSLSASALLLGVESILVGTAKYFTIIQMGIFPSTNASEKIFTLLYSSLCRKDDPQPTALLFGFETQSLQAEKSIHDLAAWAKTDPGLVDYLMQTPSDHLSNLSISSPRPEATQDKIWRDWLARAKNHLDQFGYMIYDLDFSVPTLSEYPRPIFDELKSCLSGRVTTPYARQEQACELREQTTKRIMARLKWPVKGWFEKSLKWAQKFTPAREDCLTDMGLGYQMIRRLLGELETRLIGSGALRSNGDIYWLEEEELTQLVVLLDQSQPLPDSTTKIEPRKTTWRSQLKLFPPAILPQNSRWAKITPWHSDIKDDVKELKGIAASPGTVTARACVITEPADFHRMQPGSILVAVTTTPAWTPLFTLASAVVTDIGGPLSHSSIVAREYGIPAVMSTGVGTRVIKDGQTITVDGDAGIVSIG